MKTKFIDFEGIHGSGKSSSAWLLFKNLQMNHINAHASFEAQMDEPRENLLDFSFVAVLSSTELNEIINELLRFSDSSKEYIVAFINELVNVLSPLNPIIFYLKPNNIKNTIDKIALERLSDNYDLYPDWIDWMVEYVKNSLYGNKFNVKDQSGLLDYFMKRVELEDYLFSLLKTDKQIIHIDKIDKDSQNNFIYQEVTSRLQV